MARTGGDMREPVSCRRHLRRRASRLPLGRPLSRSLRALFLSSSLRVPRMRVSKTSAGDSVERSFRARQEAVANFYFPFFLIGAIDPVNWGWQGETIAF